MKQYFIADTRGLFDDEVIFTNKEKAIEYAKFRYYDTVCLYVDGHLTEEYAVE